MPGSVPDVHDIHAFTGDPAGHGNVIPWITSSGSLMTELLGTPNFIASSTDMFGTNVIISKKSHPDRQPSSFTTPGRLAQLVERPLSMREAGGSIPPVSILFVNRKTVPEN